VELLREHPTPSTNKSFPVETEQYPIFIPVKIIITMAPLTEADKGDFKDKQFAENEVADKVVEQCE
jgi:hypothetical protein